MLTTSESETFGRWLKRRRRQLDLTQDQLGRLAGCSGAAIRKFEAEERKPSRQLAELLCAALQISPGEREAFLLLARGVIPEFLPALAPPVSPPSPAPPADNLPAPLTSLVDRVKDTTVLSAMLIDPAVRWVTLIGPPGIGKTRLSIQGGRQVLAAFQDGVWFVDLSPIDHPANVLSAIGRALASLELLPAPSQEQLAVALKDRALLLILDNFEHIPDAAIEIAGLLKRCARLKVLATSRVPLWIYGEHTYHVPPLSVPPRQFTCQPQDLMDFESVQLFVARARQHQPTFAIASDTAAAIVEIVNTLDGIPLALELAAATLQRMTLSELDRLLHHLEGENWLRQVGAIVRDLPRRQHTLENVIAWSYSLLTEPQRELFSGLAVFPGWFDVEATAAVCFSQPQDQAEVRSLLLSLENHSLLVRGATIELPSWRMLEIIREYASLQLNPAMLARLEERRALHYLSRLRSIQRGQDRSGRENFFLLHIENLQACLKWAIAGGHTELGFSLAGYLDEFWSSHGYFKEVLETMKQLFSMPDAAAPETRAYRLKMASDLAWQQHDFETSLNFAREAVELQRMHGLPSQYADDLNRLGRIYLERGEYTQAHQALEESLTIARSDPHSLNPGVPLSQLGELALFEGRLEEAKTLFHGALAHLDETQTIFLAITHVDLAEIALAEQDYPQAQKRLEQAYSYARIHIRRTLVFLCAAAGYMALAPGKATASMAARLYGALDALSERSGIVLSPFYHRLSQARIQAARQRLTRAEWQAGYEAGKKWTAETALAQAHQACAAG